MLHRILRSLANFGHTHSHLRKLSYIEYLFLEKGSKFIRGLNHYRRRYPPSEVGKKCPENYFCIPRHPRSAVPSCDAAPSVPRLIPSRVPPRMSVPDTYPYIYLLSVPRTHCRFVHNCTQCLLLTVCISVTYLSPRGPIFLDHLPPFCTRRVGFVKRLPFPFRISHRAQEVVHFFCPSRVDRQRC